jgi:hypothetical protein
MLHQAVSMTVFMVFLLLCGASKEKSYVYGHGQASPREPVMLVQATGPFSCFAGYC